MSKFEPLHKAHAIEQVQIAIRFAQPISATAFEKIRDAMSHFKGDSELPGHSDLQTMVMSFGGAPVGAVGQRVSSAGFVKSRVAPSGAVLVEMIIEPLGVNFRTMEYSRWNDVWQEYSKYLNAISNAYSEVENTLVPLSASLSYADKFIWMGAIEDCVPGELLRPGSPYVCGYVYEKNDLWHSHTGEFQKIDDSSKRLVNLNIDCLDEVIDGLERRVVRMTTVLTDIYNQPGFQTRELPSSLILSTLEKDFELLHAKSKFYFEQIISKSMCDRVALIKP
jgi:hypothetical protein